MLEILSSVGCAIDDETLMTYPLDCDGIPDESWAGTCESVHLDDITDCCEEWFAALSDSDRKIVEGLRK